MTKKLAIIGAGAAGMFCLANIIEQENFSEFDITIFEALKEPLQKLLATGGGRCNLTNNIKDNKILSSQYLRGEKFLYSIFNQFNAQDTIHWFEQHDIKTYTDDQGCVFPGTDKAQTIKNLLFHYTRKNNVTLKTFCCVEKILFHDHKFTLETKTGSETFDYILLSTGGKFSIKKNITIINGYNLALSLGHTITGLYPGLTSLKSDKTGLSNLSGITLENTKVTLYSENKKLAQKQGDLLFTHKGLSGPVILDLSSMAACIVDGKYNKVSISLNFSNAKNPETFDKELIQIFMDNKNKAILTLITRYCPRNLAGFILEDINIDPEKKANSITKTERKHIANALTDYRISISGADTASAMVTAGGVNLKEVDSRSLESKLRPGLFFAGEILDVDGFCGGYNLQFAWSSGYIVARTLGKK
jgi:hypothetical protein